MRNNENIYEKLQEVFGFPQPNINVLEKNIDSGTQVEYFEYAQNYSIAKTEEEIINDKDCLLDTTVTVDEKKSALIELASLKNVEAYRAIEKYLNQPNIKLYDWACLALQESRLKIESDILNENKVLISTGLGGKGFLLRYFIVLFTPNGNILNTTQRKIIKKEVDYSLKKYGAEFEDIEYDDSFASILCMIPLNIAPQGIFKEIVYECNQLGNFLFNDFIITNMKALNTDDIQEILRVNNIY